MPFQYAKKQDADQMVPGDDDSVIWFKYHNLKAQEDRGRNGAQKNVYVASFRMF